MRHRSVQFVIAPLLQGYFGTLRVQMLVFRTHQDRLGVCQLAVI